MKKLYLLVLCVITIFRINAQVTVTPPAPLVISDCGFPTAYFTLGNISISEGISTADFTTSGTYTISAPANFEFDPASGGITKTGSDITVSPLTVTATDITFTVTVTSILSTDNILLSGVKVRAINAPTGSSNIVRTGGTAVFVGDDVPDAQNHGTVSSVLTPAPFSDAGTNVTTCSNSGAVNITAGSNAANYNTITWTSSGTGTFTNANSTSTATYAPSAADISAGSVILTLTATPNGSCANATSTKTLTITPAPVAVAGTPIVACSNSTSVPITAGSSASNYTGIMWSSNGSGTFTNQTSLTTATYTPSAADIAAGSVMLSLVATGNAPCLDATSTKLFTINQAATANAGSNQTICSGTSASLVGIIGGSATSSIWTSPTGSFSNAASLTSTYTPVGPGPKVVTLTTNDPDGSGPCTVATSQVTIQVNAAPTVSISAPANGTIICPGIATTLTASRGGGSGLTTSKWTVSPGGSGTFGNVNNASTTFTPLITTSGVVTLTITTNDVDGPAGPCVAVAASVVVNVLQSPTATISGGTTVCQNATAPVITFTNPQASAITVTYNINSGTNTTINVPANGTNTVTAPTTTAGTFNYNLVSAAYSSGPGCSNSVSGTASVVITPNNTITLTSAAATTSQTVCINTAITNITYSTNGATGATFSGLPAGVTGNWAANVVTLSGTPTASGTFNYTVTTTGGCTTPAVTATGSITVTPNNTITRTSAAATTSQTVCINTAITNITYSTTGATGATFSGLPTGVTGSWAANVVTISGTPSASGIFNYTVTTTGGCTTPAVTATGTITVTPNNTITLSSAAATTSQSVCINTAITNITYSTTGATGATFSGLPTGVTGSWAANVVTISGTPSTTTGSPFSYTVNLTGGCGVVTATGTITVKPNNTITLTSAAATTSQSVCINTAITNITYSTTGATGATFSGLPAGVTGNWAANVVTISGTPTASGTFNYTVTTTGGCTTPAVTATGSITVTPNNTITRTSAAATTSQTVCINTAITNITYSTTGATGATFSGLPTGVTGSWAANVVTISGTPSASGIFNYTVTTTGGCTTPAVTATGTITVTPNNTITLSSAAATTSQSVCINTAITNITYSTTGATGATFSGLPTGVTGSWAANVVTISGTPSTTTGSPFSYTVNLTGGCGVVTATGTITVKPNNTITLTSAAATTSQSVCINTAITNITYSTTGATGATFSGLPAGITGNWAANVVTISGTPTTATGSPFSYTVNLTGGCGVVTATGTITVNAAASAPTSPQNLVICQGGSGTISVTTGTASTGSVTLTFSSIPAQPSEFGNAAPGGIISSTTMAALPAGAVVTSATLSVPNIKPRSPSWQSEVYLGLSGAVVNSAAQGTGVANNSALFTYTRPVPVSSINVAGGTVNLLYWNDNDDVTGAEDNFNSSTGTLVINYNVTLPVKWYDAATSGTLQGTGNPFNPSSTAVLPNTNTVGTYNFYAEAQSAAGCPSSSRTLTTVTINALPTVVTTVPGSRCGTGTVGLSATGSANATIDWYTAATGGTLLQSGTAAGANSFTTPSIATTTTYYAQARNLTTGCLSTVRMSVVATVNASPTLYTVTGGGPYCFGGAGLPVGLSGSQAAASNVTYQLFRGATPVGGAVAGTGAAIAFGIQTIAGTYTVTATNNVTGCSIPMTGSVTITINNPIITSVTANPASLCLGGTVSLTALPVSGNNLISENFEGTSTFTIVNSGTAAKQWNLRSSPYTYTGTPITITDGSKFMVAVADSGSAFGSVNGQLVSPVANTNGYATLTLTFNMYYKPLGDDVFVEASTDGGTTWTTVVDYTTAIGTATAFAAQSVNLNTYVNNANFKIRFRYNSGFGYYVAIDDVVLTAANPINYSWTSTAGGGLPAGAGTPNVLNSNIIATPTASGTIIYTATQSDAIGCVSPTKSVNVTVKPVPVISTQPVNKIGCIGDTLTFTAAVTGTGQTYQWQRGNTNLTNSAHIQGATTNTLTVDSIILADQGSDYHLVITNGNGCIVSTDSVTLTVSQPIVITSQPVDKSICAGANTSFSVTTSLPGYTYQWRRGEINIVNGGPFSGATTATLTITGASSAEQDSAYNVVITGNCIAPEISDYASLTVTNPAVKPMNPPSFLLFPTVNPTSVVVSFNASSDATNYLIIVKNNGTPPATPVDGTTYIAGSGTLAAGRIEYTGTNTFVTSNGLSPNVTYCYWIYPFNKSTCGTVTKYGTAMGTYITGCVTTSTVNMCGTPIAALYWAGTSSIIAGNASPTTNFNTPSNWSTAAGSYAVSPVAPSGCNDVFVRLNSTAYIVMTANSAVNNLTLNLQGNGNQAVLSTEGFNFIVNGDASIDATTGNNSTKLYIGEYNLSKKGYTDFKANVTIGATAGGGISHFVGHTGTKLTFRGDLVLGQRAGIDNGNGGTYLSPAGNVNLTPDTTEFDGPGLQQVTWNNNQFYANFRNVVVGNQNNPVVRHVTGLFVPDNIINSLIINGSSVVDLALSQWNKIAGGGGFLTMKDTSKLILGNDLSGPDGAQPNIQIPGSNFPGGFGTISLSPTSTIEYNAVNTKTQTVYAIPSTPYGNLTLTNGTGPLTTPLAPKITTAVVTVLDSMTINSGVNFTPGANFVITQGTPGRGGYFVNNNATLTTGTYATSGTGIFNLLAGGNLFVGSPLGITALPSATGNITATGARNFSTAANYTYYGVGALVTGNGLPFLMNNLTINNNAGITMNPAGRNYTVAGTLTQTAGPLVINGDTLTISKLTRNSGTFTGATNSSIGIAGGTTSQPIPLFFTAGARILKDLFLTTNSYATLGLGQRLDIAAGAAPGSITVGAGATFTTHDSLALKSDIGGTARVGIIPQDASGNALGTITGNVTVERYYPKRRAWRLITAPVSTTRTIYNEWQVGGKPYTAAPNSGMFITSPTGGSGLDVSAHFSMKTFDPVSGLLVNVTNTNVPISNNLRQLNVPDNKGYFTFVRGDRNPMYLNPYPITNAGITTLRDTGALQTGMKTFGPVASGKFMLIGNPYAAPVDFGNLVRTNVNRIFYAWDPRLNSYLGAYATIDGQVGPGYVISPIADPMKGTTGQQQIIQSSQAFFVKANASGMGSVTFNESAKSVVNNNTVFRPAAPEEDTVNVSQNLRSNLYLEDPDTAILADGVYQQFNNNFDPGVDDLDDLKFTNFLENFGIAVDGKVLSIERRPIIKDIDTIFFKLWNTTERKYQFRFSSHELNHPDLEGFLVDNFTKTKTPVDLNGYTNISFTVTGDAASKAIDRFMIVFNSVAAGPLPVTFTFIKAYQQDKNINVDWNVANEISIKQYEIERSLDGTTFSKAVTVAAKGNNISSNQSYTWPDADVKPGTYYYRIHSIGIDGKVVYTNVVKVIITNGVPRIFVYPNPIIAGDNINIHFINQPSGRFGLRLINKLGQLIVAKQVEINGSNSVQRLPFSKVLAHANYQLEITKPDGSKTNITLLY